MTRAILLPIGLLIVALFLFGIIQYFSNRQKEAQWEEDKRLLEDALYTKTLVINELESQVGCRR